MTCAQHTPGPWKAEAQDMFGDVNIVLYDDTEDARAIACAVSNLRPDHEIVANARLIAAAPELLKVLQEVRGTIHQHYVDWDGEPEDALPLQFARAKCDRAIAKARGQ